jgi:DNA gyrase subunit A
VRRRHQEPSTEQQIENLEDRRELYDAIERVLAEPYELWQLLLDSPDPDAAVIALQDRFGLTEMGARAVIDVQLRRVTRRDRTRIEQELAEIDEQLAVLRARTSGDDPT